MTDELTTEECGHAEETMADEVCSQSVAQEQTAEGGQETECGEVQEAAPAEPSA